MTVTAHPNHPHGPGLGDLGRLLHRLIDRFPLRVGRSDNYAPITCEERSGSEHALPPLPRRRHRLSAEQEALLLHDVCADPGCTRAGLPHAPQHAVGTYIAVDYAGWVTTQKPGPDPDRWRVWPTDAGRAALQRARQAGWAPDLGRDAGSVPASAATDLPSCSRDCVRPPCGA